MRDVAISAPIEGNMGIYGYGWIVCVQANSKNRMGGYIGLTNSSYLIKNNTVTVFKENDDFCDGVQFAPWPEMENAGDKPNSRSMK